MVQIGGDDFPVLKVSIERRDLPAFYAGVSPLAYTVYAKSLSAVSIPHGRYVLVMDFGDFHNVFEYSDEYKYLGVACSARTYNREKELLAEATMVSLGIEGVEIEEVHHAAGGQPSFRCKSQIVGSIMKARDAGEKSKESDVQGRKKQDYYFLWPVDLM